MSKQSFRFDRIEGTAIPLRGNNIDTDRIIPARLLKTLTFQGLGDHVFEDDRQLMSEHPFSDPRYVQATVLLVNENFGSGSSREHAPQALKRWGITACLGQSFSEIFQGNALAIGLPCATVERDDIEFLMRSVENTPDIALLISISKLSVKYQGRTVSLAIPGPIRKALLDGYWDPASMLLEQFSQVRAVAERLPYVTDF